ncbi:AAA family ATPase [Pleomorphomonas sp. PLEO]|uniref:AAA family ATPase n=1 Tax=Pleomorphomonas sp. PLEO TaxID=3239306 RepID=UPI00351E5BB7
MNLRIRDITVNNFRKFREPLTIQGLSDGLNIVIEANEAGKSTILEALRAVFFVRHSTRNQLASSFAPHGENVAPEIEVGFELDGDAWSISKRFLRSPSIEVRGPTGRTQGDAAEELLQGLLGFERDTSRTGDVAAYGALGLLWVAQTEALKVAAPGQIVRDGVRSTLEAEVGSIMGGEAYERVRSRIDAEYIKYWTSTGRVSGRQSEAKERAEAAETKARDIQGRLVALEQNFGNLESSRTRLRLLDQELADTRDVEARAELIRTLEIARAAAMLLSTRRAEHEAATAIVRGKEDLKSRHQAAAKALIDAEAALTEAKTRRIAIVEDIQACKVAVDSAREALIQARANRQQARKALTTGEALVAANNRAESVRAARERHKRLVDLEVLLADATRTCALLIPTSAFVDLVEIDRSLARAQAELAAGSTRIELKGPAAGITIDGEPMSVGEHTLLHETVIDLGSGAALVIKPPTVSGSAEAEVARLKATQESKFAELNVVSLDAARARNDAAREAAAEARSLRMQIEAITQADAALELSAGAESLKLFVAGLEETEGDDSGGLPDMAALRQAADAAEVALARAEGVQESAIDGLRELEEQDRPLAVAEAGAESELQNARRQLAAIESRADFAGLIAALDSARKAAAEATVNLEEAERNASAHDAADIERRIRAIDARSSAAAETKRRLETDIARLEGTVDSEGGKGLAEQVAFAVEESEAARKHLERVTQEASTLKLLRETLEAARIETSRNYVGPVVRRARRYIERLLPGCDLSFSDDLALESVVRGGVAEDCVSLSHGTQEQLAVLTRIAFADMLLDQRRPVSLILDDPLAYSDDARLDIMIDIITEAAERMQVILLTCRDRAFRHVGGRRIMLGGGR